MAFNTLNSDIRLHTNAVSRDHLSSLNKSIKSLINYTDGKTKSLSKKTIDLLEKNNIISKNTDNKPVTKSGAGTQNGKVSRINKAEKWRDYSNDTLVDGIDTTSYGYNEYNKAVNPLSHAVKSKLTGGAKKPSKWVAHVKEYAKKHKVPYNEALKMASASYKKKGAGYNTIR
jgi:hypothetical protein